MIEKLTWNLTRTMPRTCQKLASNSPEPFLQRREASGTLQGLPEPSKTFLQPPAAPFEPSRNLPETCPELRTFSLSAQKAAQKGSEPLHFAVEGKRYVMLKLWNRRRTEWGWQENLTSGTVLDFLLRVWGVIMPSADGPTSLWCYVGMVGNHSPQHHPLLILSSDHGKLLSPSLPACQVHPLRNCFKSQGTSRKLRAFVHPSRCL